MLRVMGPALSFTFAVAPFAAAALFRDRCCRRRRSRHRAEAASCPIPETADRLEGVTPEGDLSLASYGLVRLARVRASEAPWRGAALARLRDETGREVRVAGPEARDRWGRRAVRLVVVAGAAAGGAPGERDLGQALWRRGCPGRRGGGGGPLPEGTPGRRGGRTTAGPWSLGGGPIHTDSGCGTRPAEGPDGPVHPG